MRTPSLNEFKQWAKVHASIARAVCLAQAFAQCERERVDAYTQPILDAAGITDSEGKPITNLRNAWLCADDGAAARLYADFDAAHRVHGFDGPNGHCPALIANTLQIKAENALIDAGCKLLAIERAGLYGDNRARMIDLLLGACLKRETEARAA